MMFNCLHAPACHLAPALKINYWIVVIVVIRFASRIYKDTINKYNSFYFIRAGLDIANDCCMVIYAYIAKK